MTTETRTCYQITRRDDTSACVLVTRQEREVLPSLVKGEWEAKDRFEVELTFGEDRTVIGGGVAYSPVVGDEFCFSWAKTMGEYDDWQIMPVVNRVAAELGVSVEHSAWYAE